MDVRLSICIPTGGTIKTDTVSCLFSALSEFKHSKHISFLKGGYSYQNRNIGIKNAQDTGATHILFIDADMVFSSDALQKLIDADKDIVGANYHERKFPLTSTIKMRDADGKGIKIDEEKLPKELFQVFVLGGGLMMVKMTVFEELQSPYFQAPSGKTIHDFMTEDVYFCEQAHKAGLEVWCDGSIEAKHVGEYFF